MNPKPRNLELNLITESGMTVTKVTGPWPGWIHLKEVCKAFAETSIGANVTSIYEVNRFDAKTGRRDSFHAIANINGRRELLRFQPRAVLA